MSAVSLFPSREERNAKCRSALPPSEFDVMDVTAEASENDVVAEG